MIGRNALPPGNEDLGQGYGFGLGFQVLLDPGVAGTFGSPGLLDWGGIYGTSFWADPEQKIGRPRQLYIGETQRDYVPVGQR